MSLSRRTVSMRRWWHGARQGADRQSPPARKLLVQHECTTIVQRDGAPTATSGEAPGLDDPLQEFARPWGIRASRAAMTRASWARPANITGEL